MARGSQLYIGGEWTEPSSQQRLSVISPSTEEIIARVPEAREADIDRAAESARAAFDDGPWPQTTPAERAEKLRRIAGHLSERSDEIGRTITSGVGCPIGFGRRQSRVRSAS
jgi:aldehyde dehydrogenase (NAD+)